MLGWRERTFERQPNDRSASTSVAVTDHPIGQSHGSLLQPRGPGWT